MAPAATRALPRDIAVFTGRQGELPFPGPRQGMARDMGSLFLPLTFYTGLNWACSGP